MKAEALAAGEAVAAPNPALDAPMTIDTQLAQMAKKVKALQEKLAETVAGIAAQIESVKGTVSDRRLRRYLVAECGLDPSELKTFWNFETALGAVVPNLIETRVSFSALKAIVAAPQDVRNEAFDAVRLGSNVHARDVSAIKRRVIAFKVDPQEKFERNRLMVLRKSSGRLAVSRLESFRVEAKGFATELVAFYNLGLGERHVLDSSLAATRKRLQEAAAGILAKFRETFDIAALPEPWLYDCHETPTDDVRLARAHDTLQDLGAGRFQAWDEMLQRPFDTDHDFLDRSLVENIVWLCDGAKMPPRKTFAQARPGTVFLEPPRRLASLEICAGAGGQAIGLHAAGFDAQGIYEIKPDAVATLKANYLLGPCHNADVRAVDFTRYAGRLDLVAGGVPCQPHSSLGLTRGREDERDLFLEAVRLVKETRPRAFFFENVKGFSFSGNTGYRAELHDLFKELGYDSKVFSLRGDHYGLAQGRPRVAFIGFRDGLLERFRMPPVMTPQPVTVGEALYDIVAKNGWEGARAWADTKACFQGPTIVGASDASGRLGFSSNLRAHKWEEMDIDPVGIGKDSPAPGHAGSFKLTLEMGARLQGFPSTWQFVGSTTSQKRQIANALPPVMARAIGLAIHSALTGVEFDYQKALARPLLGNPPGELARINIARRGSVELENA